MSRKRHLKPDELDLWRQVAKTATPLSPAQPRPKSPPQLPERPARAAPSAPPPPVAPFSVGQKAGRHGAGHDVLPGLTDRIGALPVTMDRKAYGKLKRGKLVPEARIDLHGMTVDRAHGALTGFILRAHGQGKRLVLVITGKGRRSDSGGPIPVRQGVLRYNVPHWLSIPPLAGMVMQVTNAHARHGGGGAYYVYLKRPR
ncbi:DNA mismatch repair protein MutS [Pelagivirga sediminicola]|uniref:DNA mismatch repair protein MutS n=1 Tax=Pelagivirga sediminicola TaxID=2170575 RepID=A0A2T7G8M3_9RHOB|nr:Smr/MutS family protein [Pelagivirga sediminicola]PVA10769.1 DNA mismatch repair protein MutS [Pelagivirga sediminicola]